MVSTLMIYIELTLDITAFIMGTIVLSRSHDNTLQKAWGMLAISLSLLLFCDNLEWVILFSKSTHDSYYYPHLPLDHLSLWHIFRAILFFQIFSLFPMASLRPGWLTTSKIISMSIPFMLIWCIILCYIFFNGEITPLKQFEDIGTYWKNLDVKVRLYVFIFSVIAPSYIFMYPILRKWEPMQRKQSKGMYFYIVSFALIMGGYIWLMLGTSSTSFNLFGYIVIIPVIYLNGLYLHNENPLSLPRNPIDKLEAKDIEAIQEIEVSPVVLQLSKRLEQFINEQTPFIHSEYSLKDLLKDLGTNEHRLNKTLRYLGFSGFRDYINFNRLQYFKQMATENKFMNVKELMYKSGFTSKSTFYRYFASIEKMSPSEFLEKLQLKNE